MSSPRHDAYDAGLLLAYALKPRQRPGRADEYARLVDRFQHDRPFRTTVEELCKGMRLVVLDCGPEGLLLGCHGDSVFATRLDDFRRGGSFEDRVAYGLIYLAIAAWCFPRPEDLDDAGRVVSRIEAADIARELLRWCEETDGSETADFAALTTEEMEARRVLLSRAAVRETDTGKLAADSIQGMVEYALSKLEENGLLTRTEENDRRLYNSTERFRLQVLEMAGHNALELLLHAVREKEVG